MVWTTYKEKIKRLSQQIVDAQRPIRVLDAIKWDASFDTELRKGKFKQMPVMMPADYAKVDLGYDPKAKIHELTEISREIESALGADDPLGHLLCSIAEEYRDVVHMVLQRGKPEFYEYSKRLYGSTKDHLFGDKNTISDLGRLMYSIFTKIDDQSIGQDFVESIPAEEVVDTLNERFKNYFTDDPVRSKLSDGIVADAAAGGESVRIREGTLFSARDIDILEVHEGWVHVGTSLNGSQQHVAKWLAKGPPRCAGTQEGLAVIMEIFTFRSYPRRAREINDRILGIEKVEDGANLLELIEFYRTEGYSENDCIKNVKRIFRGCPLDGGAAFTKDIAYCRGFIENYNFMRAAIRAGRPYLLPFLFVGKTHVEDVPLLYQKYREGIVDPPRYLPPQFKDLGGVAVWMGFSSFLNMVDLKSVQEHFDHLFTSYS